MHQEQDSVQFEYIDVHVHRGRGQKAESHRFYNKDQSDEMTINLGPLNLSDGDRVSFMCYPAQ